MSINLVAAIMAKIGLSNEPSYYIGSGCLDIRKNAVAALPKAIEQYSKDSATKDQIMPPNQKLMALAKELIEDGNDTRTTVNYMYGALYDIIAAHVAAAYEPKSKRAAFFNKRYEEIRKVYLAPDARFADGKWIKRR